MAKATIASTTIAMAPPTNAPVNLAAPFDCFESSRAPPGAVAGTGAAACMAARKPSISSGLKTAVLEEVMTTTELLRLVTPGGTAKFRGAELAVVAKQAAVAERFGSSRENHPQ